MLLFFLIFEIGSKLRKWDESEKFELVRPTFGQSSGETITDATKMSISEMWPILRGVHTLKMESIP